MIKVSVILPTYNSGEFLQQTLDSILSQNGAGNLFQLELIVVDDCSTDNTTTILRKNKIPFLSNDVNSNGPNKGRNIGLKAATGKYICLIDHDDTWHPDKILHQLNAAKQAPVITTGYRSSHRKLNPVSDSPGTGGLLYYSWNETFLKKLRKDKNGQPTNLSSIMIRSDLKSILFEENFGMVDFDWVLNIFEGSDSIHVNQELVYRNVNGKNLSLDLSYRLIDYHFSLLTLEKYQRQYPKEVALARRRINGTRARYHLIKGEMPESRKYFRKSALDIKTVAYYLTTFYGAGWVTRRYNVFG